IKCTIFFLAIILLGCQSNDKTSQDSPESESWENRFFVLDMTNGDTGLKDFSDHFFTNFPHKDPTLGDVVYDKSRWLHDDLIQDKGEEGLQAYTKFRDEETGYDSYRFTSKTFFNLNKETSKILFVFKGSFPSANGMWPAWWLNGSNEAPWIYKDSIPALDDEALNRHSGVGNFYDTPSSVNSPDWPNSGEIDIIENINGDNHIHNTIHTCPQMCDSEWNNDGLRVNCANAKPGDVNPGCSGSLYDIDAVEGTFACIWEKASVKFYYWGTDEVVREAGGPMSSQPEPKSWEKKYLKNSVQLFETNEECGPLHNPWQCRNCEESTSCTFRNMKMIFNTTLCGSWAGNTFDDTPEAFENCQQFIRNEGKAGIDNQFATIEYVSAVKL
ncbi:MAG: hypothetical protein HKN16_05300, partial [Saprospiraceae bacterium]|nr:hypothetical protein [Saprospiraceae bacterium]